MWNAFWWKSSHLWNSARFGGRSFTFFNIHKLFCKINWLFHNLVCRWQNFPAFLWRSRFYFLQSKSGASGRCWLVFSKPTHSKWQKKIILFKNQSFLINIGAIEIIEESCKETSFPSLGHHSNEILSWTHHNNHVFKKLVSANFGLSRNKGFLPINILNSIYQRLFESILVSVLLSASVERFSISLMGIFSGWFSTSIPLILS